jgi:hypothetical protein
VSNFLGGYYNDNFEYIPGQNWDEKNQCYADEQVCAQLEEEFYEDEGKLKK